MSGKTLASGTLPVLACAAGDSIQTTITPPPELGHDPCLTVRFALAKATPWTAGDLENASYPYQLKPRDFLVLVIDRFYMGLAGTFGWGGRPLEPYRLKTERSYEIGFVLQRS